MPKYLAICATAGINNLLGLGFLGAAIVLPYWQTDFVVNAGLWQDCETFPDECTEFKFEDIPNHPTELNVKRALTLLAWLFSFIALLGYFCICCCKDRKPLISMQLTCYIISLCFTIAVVAYANITLREGLDTGLSLDFLYTAMANFLIASIASGVDRGNGDDEEFV